VEFPDAIGAVEDAALRRCSLPLALLAHWSTAASMASRQPAHKTGADIACRNGSNAS
jgi:hypothetical protein